MRKILLTAICFLLLINLAYGEVALGDIQKVVREENKKTIDEISTKLDKTKTDIQTETIDFANRVMADVSKMITDTEKKIILISGVSIIGILLLIEGILGFIRIRREQNVLLIIKKDIDYLRVSYDSMKIEFDKFKEVKTKQQIQEVKVDKEEEIKQNKIRELEEQLKSLKTQKRIPDFIEEAKVDIPVPEYVPPKAKKGFFGKRKKVE